MENNKEQKEKNVKTVSLSTIIFSIVIVALVAMLGVNYFAYKLGKPNLYSSIAELFKEDSSKPTVVVVGN